MSESESEWFLFLPDEVDSMSPRYADCKCCYIVDSHGFQGLIERDRRATDNLERVVNASLSTVEVALERAKQIAEVRKVLDVVIHEKDSLNDYSADMYDVLEWVEGLLTEALHT